MIMYKYVCSCAALTAVALWQSFAADPKANDWGLATNNLQMSITVEDVPSIKPGQPLNLLVHFKNVSTNEVFDIYEVNGTVFDSSYSFVVTSPSGKDISPDLAKFQEASSGRGHKLDPGRILDLKFGLAKLLTLDDVGTYTIVAKKKVWSGTNGTWFEVVSNILKVTVALQ
jgi:hypothetical protein